MNSERLRHHDAMKELRHHLLNFFGALRKYNSAEDYRTFIENFCEPIGITPDIAYHGALDSTDRTALDELMQAALDQGMLQNPFEHLTYLSDTHSQL